MVHFYDLVSLTGQGHSLRSSPGPDDRMPTDIPMSPKRSEARPLNMFCDPNFHQESIEEEDEEEATEDKEMTSEQGSHQLRPFELMRGGQGIGIPFRHPSSGVGKIVRKGPGYSELSPILENRHNESKSEGLHELVSCIEKAVETMGKKDDIIESALSASMHNMPRSTTHPFQSGNSLTPTNSNDTLQSVSDRSMIQNSSATIANHSNSNPSFLMFDSASDNNCSYSPVSLTSLTSASPIPALIGAVSSSSSSFKPSNSNDSHNKLSPHRFSTQLQRHSCTTTQSSYPESPSRHVNESAVKADDENDMEQEIEITPENAESAVAAFAEKVASDIAAMDTTALMEECSRRVGEKSDPEDARMSKDMDLDT